MNTCIAYLRLPESTQTRLIGCTGVFVAKEAVSDRQLELYRQLVPSDSGRSVLEVRHASSDPFLQSILENRSVDDDSETLGSDSYDNVDDDDEWEESTESICTVEIVKDAPRNPLLDLFPVRMVGPAPTHITKLMQADTLPATQGSTSALLQLFLNKDNTSLTK
jgi:hypothetical protein